MYSKEETKIIYLPFQLRKLWIILFPECLSWEWGHNRWGQCWTTASSKSGLSFSDLATGIFGCKIHQLGKKVAKKIVYKNDFLLLSVCCTGKARWNDLGSSLPLTWAMWRMMSSASDFLPFAKSHLKIHSNWLFFLQKIDYLEDSGRYQYIGSSNIRGNVNMRCICLQLGTR